MIRLSSEAGVLIHVDQRHLHPHAASCCNFKIIRLFLTAIVCSHLFSETGARIKPTFKPKERRKDKTTTEDPSNHTLPWGPREPFAFDLDAALRQCKIVPNIIETSPKDIIQVLFEDETVVDVGAYLRPDDMLFEPKMIQWPDDDESYYTLIFADPDIPTRIDDTGKQYLYWLVVNIHKTTWVADDIIVPYIAPEPTEESGIHRVIFIVYKQPKKIKFNEPRLDEERFDDRRANFVIKNFVRKYRLGKPHAVNFFLCENWDHPIDDDHPLAVPTEGFAY